MGLKNRAVLLGCIIVHNSISKYSSVHHHCVRASMPKPNQHTHTRIRFSDLVHADASQMSACAQNIGADMHRSHHVPAVRGRGGQADVRACGSCACACVLRACARAYH